MAEGKSDTAHLYDGKTIRSSAPSRKKAAGRLKGSTDIPKDAIPEVHVPSVIESFFGGPIVTKTKFLPPDRVVSSLQMSAAITLTLLSIVTFTVTPVSGTAYVILILVTIRFAGSKVEFGIDLLPDGEIAQKLLLISYALFLVMYIELTSGIIRFSMLDKSIRTGEVYVMNVKKITRQYYRSLMITPLVAGLVALVTLMINLIIPTIVGLLGSESAATRLAESVELTSVYGVALGTAVVFMVVASAFAVNLPVRLAQMRENTGK
jgi:hypothetical protein